MFIPPREQSAPHPVSRLLRGVLFLLGTFLLSIACSGGDNDVPFKKTKRSTGGQAGSSPNAGDGGSASTPSSGGQKGNSTQEASCRELDPCCQHFDTLALSQACDVVVSTNDALYCTAMLNEVPDACDSGGIGGDDGDGDGDGDGSCSGGVCGDPPLSACENALSSDDVIVVASGQYSSVYPGSNAVDGDHLTMWISATYVSPAELTFELAEPTIVHQYSIDYSNGSITTRAPKDFELWASNDGVLWTVLDKRLGQVDWLGREQRFYQIENPSAYTMYLLSFLDDNDPYDGIVTISIGDVTLETCP